MNPEEQEMYDRCVKRGWNEMLARYAKDLQRIDVSSFDFDQIVLESVQILHGEAPSLSATSNNNNSTAQPVSSLVQFYHPPSASNHFSVDDSSSESDDGFKFSDEEEPNQHYEALPPANSTSVVTDVSKFRLYYDSPTRILHETTVSFAANPIYSRGAKQFKSVRKRKFPSTLFLNRNITAVSSLDPTANTTNGLLWIAPSARVVETESLDTDQGLLGDDVEKIQKRKPEDITAIESIVTKKSKK